MRQFLLQPLRKGCDISCLGRSSWRMSRSFSGSSVLNEINLSRTKNLFLNDCKFNKNSFEKFFARRLSNSVAPTPGGILQETEKIPSKKVAFWLLGSSALVLAIVVVGGITRLTESGLSITEWKPITGVIPPLTDEQWNQEFELYKKSPEFEKLNSHMTVDEFKNIFFWEWFHRVLGRGIGLTILLPSIYMIVTKRASPWLSKRLIGLTGLVGLQGVIGWWMVKSGLSEELFSDGSHPRVSHYRLATHLAAAVALYIGLVWTGHGILQRHAFLKSMKSGSTSQLTSMVSSVQKMKGFRTSVNSFVGLVLITLLSGAFVAGLDAGMIYCTFPEMGEGRLAPSKSELFDQRFCRKDDKSDLIWRNMIDNPSLVQLEHRILAITTFVAACGLFIFSRAKRNILPKKIKTSINVVTGVVTAQATLGIMTLIYVVPVPLAALHQAGSLVTLTAALSLAQRLHPEYALKNIRSWTKLISSPPKSSISSSILTQQRQFHTFRPSFHSEIKKPLPGTGIKVFFVTPEGREIMIEGNEGDSILDLAHANNIDLEGACEGSVACSTCHVIVDPEHYELLDPPEEDEEDMLDLAFGLEETSRLGCQVLLRKDLDGIRVRIPAQTRNIRLERPKA